ncbi:ATP-binding protein [Kineosporia sp. R_H_3]|uniref:ATP-binding protein n=1 Tax=Kineosporia sp. R_H_3 TaxID=1961848 RepID=UPI000B4ADB7B|nr:ATP-binding protein [Kineosporia sp. R_H_3]
MTVEATSPEGAPERVGPDVLRTLFLFESLDDDKLAWLAAHGRVERRAAGEAVYTQGDPATCFFVLLEGTVVMRRRVEDHEIEIIRTSQRGAYAGATQAYVRTPEPLPYSASMEAVTDAALLALDADEFAVEIRTWFPMAMHLLEGLFVGMRSSNEIIAQRERLLSLGRLTAGLTHELNNPAAAAVRATATLRERFSAMRHKLASLADGKLDADTLIRLTDVQEEAVARLASAPELSPLETSDAEDELTDWLDDREVPNGWELAATLVAAGLDTDWLDRVAAAVPRTHLGGGLRWVTYTLETEMLLNEIDDTTGRISALVGAAKQYSQMDRAPRQDVDVHEGLKSTLVMLGAKLRPGVTIVKDLDRTLPRIPAYPGELNQVWTNLIENAVQAMGGRGTLTVRTARDGDTVLVEIGDTGPGVPAELQSKIFEPFFTTKPVGEGTGLGLDISYRIVAQRHRGDLRVESAPGDTRFQVRLPLHDS